MAAVLRRLSQQERLNFLLTNRVPRRLLSLLMGRVSRIENRAFAKAAIALWRPFAEDLRLDEAEAIEYGSLHACFTRRFKPGVRPIDRRAGIVASPCDAEVGACGDIEGTTVYQAKGFPYELAELIPDAALRERYRDGRYLTLRLKSSMVHRFHAPVDCRTETLDYLSGDTWNVNPIALRRVEKLFCRNERAVIPLVSPATGGHLCLVPVAAILVASLRFTGLPETLDLRYRGPNRIAWPRAFAKGEEMGYFQHGSTILVFASRDYRLVPGITNGTRIRMGEALLSTTPESP